MVIVTDKSLIEYNVIPGHQIMSEKRCITPKPDSESKRIVWVDLEMTGLDIERDHIMEIACLVSDANLNVVATGPNIAIHQPVEILNSMNEWCTATHGEVCQIINFIVSLILKQLHIA